MGDMGDIAEDLGTRAHESDWLDQAIRMGLVAYGVVNLMVAWLALQLALGDQSGSASSKGAMQQLARQPFGELLIWLVAIGMFLLVLWRGLEATLGHRDEDGGDRVRKRLGSLLKALIYGSVGVSALTVAIGAGSKPSKGKSTTAKLMDLPGGTWIVGLIGLAVIGYGVAQIWRAWTEKFREHLSAEGKSGEAGRAYIMFGKVGYVAKGVAVGIVGGLFIYAALTHNARKSGGLDQALHKVLQQPFGQFLLVALALGIACYGLFNFARARHLSR